MKRNMGKIDRAIRAFVIAPAAPGLRTTVTTALAPTSSLPKSHRIKFPSSAQPPRSDEAEMNSTLAGSGLLRRTPVAGKGP